VTSVAPSFGAATAEGAVRSIADPAIEREHKRTVRMMERFMESSNLSAHRTEVQGYFRRWTKQYWPVAAIPQLIHSNGGHQRRHFDRVLRSHRLDTNRFDFDRSTQSNGPFPESHLCNSSGIVVAATHWLRK
jgi:hypothetical protein